MCYRFRNRKILKQVRLMPRMIQKRIKELLLKGKQPQVLNPRADPFDSLGLSNSGEDSATKSMRKSDTFKDFVNTPDIRPSDVSDDESDVPVTDLKIDLKTSS